MDSDSRPHIKLSTSDGLFSIYPEHIENLIRTVCYGLGIGAYEVSWDFVDSEEMRTLNRQYRGKDRSTDVLSFPQEEWGEALSFQPPAWPLPELKEDLDIPPKILGDVIICPSDAMANAKNLGHKLDRETGFLLVHGILHLCGHDHVESEDEEKMTHEQRNIMSFLERVSSEPLWSRCITVEA